VRKLLAVVPVILLGVAHFAAAPSVSGWGDLQVQSIFKSNKALKLKKSIPSHLLCNCLQQNIQWKTRHLKSFQPLLSHPSLSLKIELVPNIEDNFLALKDTLKCILYRMRESTEGEYMTMIEK